LTVLKESKNGKEKVQEISRSRRPSKCRVRYS
jgi:hypothetical protein